MDRKGLLVLVLAIGCGDDGVAMESTEGSSSDGTSTSSPSTTSGSSSTDATVSASSSTDASSSSSESSSSGPASACGDGTVDTDEECDDGNTDDGDACSSTCVLPFTIEWTQTFDGEAHLHDEGSGLAIADDGSIYVVGHAYSFAQDFDVWVGQYAPDGTAGWTFTFDRASQYDSGAAVALHPSGDLIVVGSSVAAANADVLVLRVAASDQSVVWQATYDGAFADDGSGGDYGLAVAVDPGGDVLAAGRDRGENGSHDILLARYDADGNELWRAAQVAPDTVDEGAGVIVDDAGIAWLVGTIDLTDNDTGWLGGYAADGTLVDEHTFEFHGFHGVTLASDGRLVICGRRPSAGVNDASAMILDGAFEPEWELLHDSGASDAFLAVATAPNGDVYVTGYEFVQHRGVNQDIIVARLSGTDGTPVWIDRYDSEIEMDDLGTAIAIAPDGSIVVAGTGNAFGENRNIFVRKYVEP